MSTQITATHLRAKLFSTLDHVVATGNTIEIKRPNGSVRIMRDATTQRLAALKPHPNTIIGDADELASLSWEHAWNPAL